MAKLEDIDPTLDPIVIAAMLDDDDPNEAEEDKSSQATVESETENEDEQEDEKKTPEDGNEVEEKPSTEKEEAELEETKIAEDGSEQKLTRKEKREAKRQKYLDAIRKEGEQNSNRVRPELFQADPNYKPLDFNQVSDVEVDDLIADRNKNGQNNFAKGAQLARHIADQESFWQGVEYEDKILTANPKYKFLDDSDPDNFDGDRAEELHELFFELVGKDPETNMVRRTDLSWSKFVENEVARIERYAKRNEADIIQNAAAQRATTGIRPSGSASKSLGKLKPGDISKMSQKEFEKHEAEIDRQIMAELG